MRTVSEYVKELQSRLNLSTIDSYVLDGLELLQENLREDFFDIEEMPTNRYSKEGLFLELSSIHCCENVLGDNRVILGSLCKVEENGYRNYLAHMEVTNLNESNTCITFTNHTTTRDEVFTIIQIVDNKIHSQFESVEDRTLSDLLREFYSL